MNTAKINGAIRAGLDYFGHVSELGYLGTVTKAPRKKFIDKLGRKISEYTSDALVIAENKGGSKVVCSGFNNAKVIFDKSGNVVYESTNDIERFFFPNGNFVEISRINGNRTGDMLVYTSKYPNGLDIRSHGSEKNGYYTITDLATGVLTRLRSVSGKFEAANEREWLKGIQELFSAHKANSNYSPGLLRAVLDEVI